MPGIETDECENGNCGAEAIFVEILRASRNGGLIQKHPKVSGISDIFRIDFQVPTSL